MPWLAALDRVTTLRGALAAGLLMSELFTLAVFAWFAPAIAGYAGGAPIIGWIVLALLAPLLQPQFVPFALARTLLRRRGSGLMRSALAGAGAYVGAEWVLAKLFADTIGHGLLASPLLRQAADVAGAPGLTFVLIVANECALAAFRGGRRRAAAPVLTVAGLAAALLFYGAVRSRQLGGDGADPVRAAIVQADVSNYAGLAAEMGTYGAVRLILDRHETLSAEALAGGGVDLLVWPETVYPTTFASPRSDDGAAFDAEIVDFVEDAEVPLVFGTYDAGDDGAEYNAAVLVEPERGDRRAFPTYRKARLFPLTERVPAWLDSDRLRAWLPWLGTWRAGAGSGVLDATLPGGRRVRLAPLVCYDAVDPGLALEAVRAGAEVIVTLSNDSWFAAGGGPRLHLVVSAFRSLETRRPQVRATNTGISALITPAGEIVATLGVHERGVLVGSVTPVRSATTLMLLWGDWFGPFALALGFVLLLRQRRR